MYFWSGWKRACCHTKAALTKIMLMKNVVWPMSESHVPRKSCFSRFAAKDVSTVSCCARNPGFLMELPQDDLEWETERKVVSAQERMVKGQSHLEKIREQLAKAKNSG